MTRRFPLYLFFIACAIRGQADDKTLEVRTLALTECNMPTLYLGTPDGHVALEWSHLQPAEPLKAKLANPLPLYREGKPVTPAEPAFLIDRKIKLPSTPGGVLLLGWSDDNTTHLVALEDNFSSARFNDWLLINAASRPVAFLVGEEDAGKPKVVQPGTSVGYRVHPPAGKGAQVVAQIPVDGKAKTVFSTYWPIYPDKRAVVIFADDGEKVRVKRISDKLKPKKDDKEEG